MITAQRWPRGSLLVLLALLTFSVLGRQALLGPLSPARTPSPWAHCLTPWPP